LQDDSLQEVMT